MERALGYQVPAIQRHLDSACADLADVLFRTGAHQGHSLDIDDDVVAQHWRYDQPKRMAAHPTRWLVIWVHPGDAKDLRGS
ncbi:MAG: hypothetical protein OXH86_06520 [Acidimicrobiaceae bacterium]|nr:hypothetical protein [Acidimicrobiaceae bacterium]